MENAEARPTNDREIAERLARCVSTMVYYQADQWSWSGAQLLWEQSRSLWTWASETRLTDDLGNMVLSPLRNELMNRFGSEAGGKLHQEFLRALNDASRT